MSVRLRDLIKSVRASKTAAEEREMITKECAKIRTNFKNSDESSDYRQRNIAKLLYIQMLGYPTHFGQMECMKLVVSPHYSDKRLGYLGLMLLMDEKQEILMLVTNSLKIDLVHPNHFVIGLALCVLANISSVEMARDLTPEVEKLLLSTNSYIRKKAALCAIRIIRKAPDLSENFISKIKSLISERNHGVLLTGVSLMVEMCQIDPENIKEFKKMVPNLVRILKSLVLSGYAPEHDVGGVTDPFLQVKILHIFGILGKNDPETSDMMNDILAQVATNTENVRNVGNAILYECVSTIMEIAEPKTDSGEARSNSGLKVLAINVLGRFLLNRDNNIRYVALNTLSKVVSSDLQAVQRHRNTIVDCLKDPDVSIRKRALELLYALVNESNVKTLVRELLNFLVVSDIQFRANLVARLCVLIEKFAPNRRWHVDTTVRVMSIAGDTHLPDETAGNLITIINQTPDLQTYAVQKLYMSLLSDRSSEPLVQVGIWCMGEYGNLLVSSGFTHGDSNEQVTATEADVLDLIEKILTNPLTGNVVREHGLNSLVKLTQRFNSAASQEKLKELIERYANSRDVEIQTRAVEYSNLFEFGDYKESLFAPIPPLERKEDNGGVQDTPSDSSNGSIGAPAVVAPTVAPKEESSLIDMDDIFGGSAPATTSLSDGGGASLDPLADLLGGGLTGGVPATTTTAAPSPLGDLADLMGGGTPAPAPTLTAAQPAANPAGGDSFIAWQNNFGVEITFAVKKNPQTPHLSLVNGSYSSSQAVLENFSLQLAVPKYIKMQIDPPSGNSVAPGAPVMQVIKLSNSLHGQKAIIMKLKINYNLPGQAPVSEDADVSFPAHL